MNAALLLLGAGDDVAIATRDLTAGSPADVSDGTSLTVTEDIPFGHKVAVRALASGDLVRKYGHIIGATRAAVARGAHLHTHNLGMPADPSSLASADSAPTPPAAVPPGLRSTFLGYPRGDGRVGTRNYIAVVSTVNCSATVVRRVVRRTEDELADLAGEGVDGVVAVTHTTGCGMAGSGEGWDILRRTLTGYAAHPNVGGVVVIGLGCEINAMEALLDDLRLAPGTPLASLTIQDEGGTAAAVDAGVARVREMAQTLRGTARVEVGVDALVLGMQCGGSDAWSALTANPALGVASDLIVAQGGTSILGETPEIYGAELMLADRALHAVDKDRLLARIRWWESYTESLGTTMDGNPSPGNKAGGITTILEKSLGSVAKGGHAPLSGYCEYAEPVPGPGLVFMDTPGYDPVSATGMVAGGANLVCFTTGRGSVFGSKPAPTVKLSTNSGLAQRMSGDIDLDCSGVVESGVSLDVMGRRVYELLLDVASGQPSHSEELGLGDEEFVPWQIGAVL